MGLEIIQNTAERDVEGIALRLLKNGIATVWRYRHLGARNQMPRFLSA